MKSGALAESSDFFTPSQPYRMAGGTTRKTAEPQC
jgi:hypothetical protein